MTVGWYSGNIYETIAWVFFVEDGRTLSLIVNACAFVGVMDGLSINYV